MAVTAKAREIAKILKDWGYTHICYCTDGYLHVKREKDGVVINEITAGVVPNVFDFKYTNDWRSLDGIINSVCISQSAYDYISNILLLLMFSASDTRLIRFQKGVSGPDEIVMISDGYKTLRTNISIVVKGCQDLNCGVSYCWSELGILEKNKG